MTMENETTMTIKKETMMITDTREDMVVMDVVMEVMVVTVDADSMVKHFVCYK